MKGELERMRRDLKGDQALEKRAQEILLRIADSGEAESDSEVWAMVARELGYDVTVADVERLVAEQEEVEEGELSLDDLSEVAGGAEDGGWIFCWADYNCFTVWNRNHANSEEVACLADYICVSVVKNPILLRMLPNSSCGISHAFS